MKLNKFVFYMKATKIHTRTLFLLISLLFAIIFIILGILNVASNRHNVTLEYMRNKSENLDNIKDYCAIRTSAKDKQIGCKSLTTTNCKQMDCCILLDTDRCVAGDTSGPIFHSDSSGNDLKYDYFFHRSSCYGLSCPNTSSKKMN